MSILFQCKASLRKMRPALPSDIWFVAQQVAYFRKIHVEKVLVANRENISTLYRIPLWGPLDIPPLRVVKKEYAHACNKAILIPESKSIHEEEDDINNWIHTCSGAIRVVRKWPIMPMTKRFWILNEAILISKSKSIPLEEDDWIHTGSGSICVVCKWQKYLIILLLLTVSLCMLSNFAKCVLLLSSKWMMTNCEFS